MLAKPKVRTAGFTACGRLGITILIAAAATGCDLVDGLLEVDSPIRVPASRLDDPATAALQVASVIADLECALGDFVVAAGTAGEEFGDSNLAGPNWPVDRRDLGDAGNNIATNSCAGGLPGLYTPLQTARHQGDRLGERLDSWTDAEVQNRQSHLATALAYSGYAVLLLSEAMCSITIDRGPELSRAQGFAEAESRFTRAIAAAQQSNNAEMLNLARVGRARARLNLGVVNGAVVNAGKLAEAAADARAVPAGFRVDATTDNNPDRRRNRVYSSVNFSGSFSVWEQFHNVTDMGVPDPRVRVQDMGVKAFDGITDWWIQLKYAEYDSPIRLASYTEAQLIIAEVEGGQTAVDIINSLHAAAGLPPFPGGTPEEIQAHIIRERAAEFWMEGHHLGDKLRYGLPFLPETGTPYRKGGFYGTDTCLQLPVQEKQSNPNFGG